MPESGGQGGPGSFPLALPAGLAIWEDPFTGWPGVSVAAPQPEAEAVPEESPREREDEVPYVLHGRIQTGDDWMYLIMNTTSRTWVRLVPGQGEPLGGHCLEQHGAGLLLTEAASGNQFLINPSDNSITRINHE